MDRRFLAIILAILVAIATRSFLYHWQNIFGIDSYWFARLGKYIFLQGELPEKDPLYSFGFRHLELPKELSMYIPAWYYSLFHTTFDVNSWMNTLKDLSLLGGVVGSVSSALLAYTVGGPLAGILGGILAAANPGYVYRTMAGFYEDDAIGMMFFLLGAWLFAEALRRKDIKFYLLAGLAWLGVALSWKVYELVVYTLGVFYALLLGKWLLNYLPPVDEKKGVVLTVLLSLIIWFAWRTYAWHTAQKLVDKLTLTTNINGVGSTILIILGLNPLIPIFMGLFSYYLLLFLFSNEKKYFTYAVIFFVASLPIYYLSSLSGFVSFINDVPVGYGTAFEEVTHVPMPLTFYQAFFGSAVVVFTVQVAAAYVGLLVGRSTGHKNTEKEGEELDIKLPLVGIVTVLLMGFLSIPYNGYNWLHDLLGGTMNLIEQRTTVIGATVVEERHGYFFWGPKYALLAIIPFIAVPFILRKEGHVPLFLLALFGITLYLGWIKLKTCYYFGAPLGIVAGLMLADAFERTRGKAAKAVAFATALVVVSTIAVGVHHTVGRIPTLLYPHEVNEAALLAPIASDLEWQIGPDLLQAFDYIDKNTEKEEGIFNWWGVGHWLTFFTDHPVATDNTNAIFEADRFVARVFLEDVNKAYGEIREKNYSYIFFMRDYIWGARSFALYAYGFEEGKKVAEDYIFMITGPCRGTKYSYYNCGTYLEPFLVDKNIYEGAPPLSQQPFEKLPKIKIGGKDLGVYKVFNRLVLVSKKMNDSLLFHLWTGGTEKLIPVFISKDGVVVVFKVE